MNETPRRPDPHEVLARVQREAADQRRGRLKVWLGGAPGVGKTYAMLAAARRRLAQGLETVVGCVETHGRAETAALLQGLELLPRREGSYEGHQFAEFDLEAALRRRPALLLVDELAHTNVPGSRFAKRWQDVEALLEAGIDVETTLNVQHIEGQNDLVAQATGVKVRETVPDRLVDGAHEVVLVDLPPEALLERLRAGKVYAPDVAQQALAGFFQRGNLTALRELALRKTAQWVDGQLQDYRRAQGVQQAWGTGERILVAVGPSPQSARLVRSAHRTATGLRAELFAVFVEPRHPSRPLSLAARGRVTEHLRLAESLGARTATLTGDDAAAALVEFARQHDIARIVVGKSGRSRFQELLFGSLPMDLVRGSGDIDVHVVQSRADEPERAPPETEVPLVDTGTGAPPWWRGTLSAGLAVGLAVAVAVAVFEPGDLSTEAMVLILGIVVASLRGGRWVALAAVVVSAAAFNFLFTEPRFTFTISDPAYMVAFGVMLVIGGTVTSLVARARERAEAAQTRERESSVLYSLARELADARTAVEVARAAVAHLGDLVHGDLAVLVPQAGGLADAGCVLASHGVPDWLGAAEFGVARWCLDHGRSAGAGTGHLPGSGGLFLPLAGHRGRVAVLAFRADVAAAVLAPPKRLLVGTLGEQVALALERLQTRDRQRRLESEIETERLRSTLLASVSHDLRTPLATITGSASSLLDEAVAADPAVRRDLLQGIATEAARLNDLIGNLVFATRLEAGAVQIRREWTSLEEVVGAALHRARDVLQHHHLEVTVAPGLPLVQADPVLLEQALFLLLDNAGRHTPPGSHVRVRAVVLGGEVALEVADDGPGVPEARRPQLFQRFARGAHSTGMGLGLAICASILAAHGGVAVLMPTQPPGAVFQLRLPLAKEPPPAAPEADFGEDGTHG